jgi:predicted RNase H-like HicB family nuclease
MAEFRRYPLRLEQSKLDGWWFIFVDAVPGLLVFFGPNYEDLRGRLKVAAGNLFRDRGETVTKIENYNCRIGRGGNGVMDDPSRKNRGFICSTERPALRQLQLIAPSIRAIAAIGQKVPSPGRWSPGS